MLDGLGIYYLPDRPIWIVNSRKKSKVFIHLFPYFKPFPEMMVCNIEFLRSVKRPKYY